MSLFPPKERREGVLFPFMARSKVKKGLETVGFGHRTTGSLSLTHMHTPLATVTQHSLHTWPPEMCPHIGQVPTGNSSWKIAGGRLPLRRAAHFTFSLIDRDGGGVDKEGRHFEAYCVLRVVSQEYPCVKPRIRSSEALARVQKQP